MFKLASSWVWDFWIADDGEQYHLFFLKASRALQDPDRRHWRAGVGHAVSTDLEHWTEVADAIVHDDRPSWDDLAIWTGSVIADPAGGWRMFYTGLSHAEQGLAQRIGSARSDDLYTWHRESVRLVPDPRWYETLADRDWVDQAWRDPWVFGEPGAWRMLITARATTGDRYSRGVVGQATSPDLDTWTVGPPLSTPDAGFGQLEVMQLAEVAGRWVLLFSCLATELEPIRRASGGGIWAVPVTDPAGPYDLTKAQLLCDHRRYVGKVVTDRTGTPVLLAFDNTGPDGAFVGQITDPRPVRWDDSGRLRVDW